MEGSDFLMVASFPELKLVKISSFSLIFYVHFLFTLVPICMNFVTFLKHC
jgi:hypothetical protein